MGCEETNYVLMGYTSVLALCKGGGFFVKEPGRSILYLVKIGFKWYRPQVIDVYYWEVCDKCPSVQSVVTATLPNFQGDDSV